MDNGHDSNYSLRIYVLCSRGFSSIKCYSSSLPLSTSLAVSRLGMELELLSTSFSKVSVFYIIISFAGEVIAASIAFPCWESCLERGWPLEGSLASFLDFVSLRTCTEQHDDLQSDNNKEFQKKFISNWKNFTRIFNLEHQII